VSDADDFRDDVVFDSAMLLGVWANATRVVRRREVFTIDFLRDVTELSRPVLVARALIPAVAAFDLRDQLGETLRSYTELSMPGEPPDVG
jgi:hypothetical protein